MSVGRYITPLIFVINYSNLMSPMFQSQTLNRSTVFMKSCIQVAACFVHTKFKLENHTYVSLRWGSANTQK